MIYLLSPRSGGPFRQLQLVAKALNQKGYPAKHCYTLNDWIKLHFNKRDKVVSVIPFLFVRNKNNFILNIRGNYRKEKRITNPLSYLYENNIAFTKKTIVPSEYLKSELGLSSAEIIPTSTDIKIKISSLTTHSSPETIQLATITNFDFRPKAQGINKLINIVNQIQSDKPIAINIYGGGRWLEHAKEQYEMHNYKKYPVIFHGAFKQATEVLPGNDIFIYWSTFDNMPNVLIEATACGLPIVVNRYAAYEEIIGTDNLAVSDEQEFTNKLLELIESLKLRKKYSDKNIERAKLFSIEENIKKWIDVIEPQKN